MMSHTRRYLLAAALIGCTTAAMGSDNYPNKPITLIVPWAPGGSTDILARALGEKLSKSLGQPIVVDNRAGASGNIGSNAVAKAKADGYTLLVGSMSTHAMNPSLMTSMPFRGVDDFTPIAMLANVVNTMVVHPLLPVNSVKEFVDYAKANPGKLNYASAGSGSTNHLSAALFEKATGITMTHVPYRGGAPAVLDTVANQTQVLFSAGTQTLPHVKNSKLKLLAVTEAERSRLLPDVPTVGETLPGYKLSVWYGLLGPKNMPKDLVDKLNAAANAAMTDPDVKTRMDGIGVEVLSLTPEAFGKALREDSQRYDKIIRELGITSE